MARGEGGGRPKADIDEEEVYKLAIIDCTVPEMAAFFGVDTSTITRRFASVIEKGREAGKSSLRRKMYQTAMGGNVTMMIWLSKNRLGMKEPKHEQEIVMKEVEKDIAELAIELKEAALRK